MCRQNVFALWPWGIQLTGFGASYTDLILAMKNADPIQGLIRKGKKKLVHINLSQIWNTVYISDCTSRIG